MLGNCMRCGALIYVNAGRRNTTLCPDCRDQDKLEKERDSQKYSWTVNCKKSQSRLVRYAAYAIQLGISYGDLMAGIYDGRIKRPEECADE